MIPKQIGAPESYPLDLAALRRQCEIVAIETDSDGNELHPDDDLLMGIYLPAAVELAEGFTGLTIAPRTLEIAMTEFPRVEILRHCRPSTFTDGAIELPGPPLIEILSFISADDSDGQMDPDGYALDDFSLIPRIVPVGAWPRPSATLNGIRVRYRAGYSDFDSDAQPVPAAIKQALLMTIADWYQNREDTVDFTPNSMPNGAKALLRPLRVRLGMA
jgi:uncharacterized phiE125 gp8 family phage protein